MARVVLIHHLHDSNEALRFATFLRRRNYLTETYCLGLRQPLYLVPGDEVVLLWSGRAEEVWDVETQRLGLWNVRIVLVRLDDAARPSDPGLTIGAVVDARLKGDAILPHAFSAISAALVTKPQPRKRQFQARPIVLTAVGVTAAIGLALAIGGLTQQNPSSEVGAQNGTLAASAGRAEAIPPSPATPHQTIKDCQECPELVIVPAGRAVIGDASKDRLTHEWPAWTVELNYRIAVARFEITFAQWDACVQEQGCAHRPDDLGWGRGDQPVVLVSFNDAQDYVQWLSRRTGHGYRLPSESEWEYAARAGSVGAFSFGRTAEQICRFGNGADAGSGFDGRYGTCTDGFPDRPAPVGSFVPNTFGLYDTAGNVWEWVQDCWHPSYVGVPRSGAPWLRGCFSEDRIARGGSFAARAEDLRTAHRMRFSPTLRRADIGFRVVRPVSDAEGTVVR